MLYSTLFQKLIVTEDSIANRYIEIPTQIEVDEENPDSCEDEIEIIRQFNEHPNITVVHGIVDGIVGYGSEDSPSFYSSENGFKIEDFLFPFSSDISKEIHVLTKSHILYNGLKKYDTFELKAEFRVDILKSNYVAGRLRIYE